jgi:hypothetical protein
MRNFHVPPLRTAFEHGLEIGASPPRFQPGGFGRFAHAEIAMDRASARNSLYLQLVGWIGLGAKLLSITIDSRAAPITSDEK